MSEATDKELLSSNDTASKAEARKRGLIKSVKPAEDGALLKALKEIAAFPHARENRELTLSEAIDHMVVIANKAITAHKKG